MSAQHAFIARAGSHTSAPLKINRPLWRDMKANYPADGTDKNTFYPKISKALAASSDHPAYANTCALRMSYALNHSGIKLGKAPSSGGNVKGDDKLNYWLRVRDLSTELGRLFKSPDEHLTYSAPLPAPTLADRTPEDYARNHRTEYLERLNQANLSLLSRITQKNGIVVFNVKGWSDATGHFTLWEGSTRNLLYVGANQAEKNPASPLFYFWMLSPSFDGTKMRLVETTSVSFWELK